MIDSSTSWRMTRFPGKAKEDQTPAESLFIPNTKLGAANRSAAGREATASKPPTVLGDILVGCRGPWGHICPRGKLKPTTFALERIFETLASLLSNLFLIMLET